MRSAEKSLYFKTAMKYNLYFFIQYFLKFFSGVFVIVRKNNFFLIIDFYAIDVIINRRNC